MKILAIDTSCDETSVAITENKNVLSNIVWSQASLHAKWGGVLPSLAQRKHEEKIDWVVNRALQQSRCNLAKIDAIAVTAGPGLAIALGVGIKKAKELALKLNKPLVPVNHIEGHLLSPLVNSRIINNVKKKETTFPALGLVVSGGHTELVLIKQIGVYTILAKTQDDALGEALDKAARMLGLGYPGGAFLEKLARTGEAKHYPLPLPMAGREDQNKFSYSGLKTAFWRMTQNRDFSKKDLSDLAASFQDMAFKHLTRIVKRVMEKESVKVDDLLVGGGVAANVELRRRLRIMGREMGLRVRFPYSNKLFGDNAAMIGVVAGFKNLDNKCYLNYDLVDRKPRWSVEET